MTFYILNGDSTRSGKSKKTTESEIIKLYGKVRAKSVLNRAKKGLAPLGKANNGTYYIVLARPFERKLREKKGKNYTFDVFIS